MRREYAPWPSEEQALLLKAALGDGDRAVAALDAWRKRFDLAGPIDLGTYRLLPLLYANLARLGCGDPIMGLLRGVRRHAWCNVQKNLQFGAEALALLNANGIPTMVSKGLALATSYYESPGLRPMSDLDILVPTRSVSEAVAVLSRIGWHVTDPVMWSRQSDIELIKSHAISLRRVGAPYLDLHWRLLRETVSHESERRLWRSAESTMVADVPTQRPNATNLLMHAAVHGVARNVTSPVRWIADAAMIIRQDAGKIDWDDMLDFASRGQFLHRMGLALCYLHREMELPIPDRVIERVAISRPTWVERLERQILVEPDLSGGSRRPWANMFIIGARLAVGHRWLDLPRIGADWLKRAALGQRTTRQVARLEPGPPASRRWHRR